MPDDEHGFSIKEVLGQITGKLDALASQVTSMGQTTAVTVAELTLRVSALEKSADRRWQLVGVWIASAVSIGIGVAELVIK